MIIKIRCWDEEAETIFYSDKSYDDHFFEFNDKGVLKCFRIDESAGTLEEPPEPYSTELDSDPELCVGLHDKNNKQIFEDDIVKDKHGYYAVKFDLIHGIRFINNQGNYICPLKPIFSEKQAIEVIGNIHENLDLLK